MTSLLPQVGTHENRAAELLYGFVISPIAHSSVSRCFSGLMSLHFSHSISENGFSGVENHGSSMFIRNLTRNWSPHNNENET